MAKRIELALPDDILDFNDQRAPNDGGSARMYGDLLARGDAPCGQGARFSASAGSRDIFSLPMSWPARCMCFTWRGSSILPRWIVQHDLYTA